MKLDRVGLDSKKMRVKWVRLDCKDTFSWRVFGA
jgi:hypothetical protein|uniref:Uncharacterized protein n=1 Tax=Populus trichocarpa TaxID=3694 RepID=A9P8M9_POPTR|nr:unknown [Populus trichocarpa]